jgi:nitrate reductase assembly molybdenum cofactor insertion protein NarJ
MVREARALELLADVMSYPGPAFARVAADCAAALAPAHPAAAERLARLAEFARADDAEAAYTAAFDLAPVTSPYVGDQLFGASRERALLMAGLRGLQRDAGVAPREELPDHVSEVLRLLAAPLPPEVGDDLARDGLAPAARRMLAALEEARHPWADAVAALIDVLGVPEADAAPACGPAAARPGLEVIP